MTPTIVAKNKFKQHLNIIHEYRYKRTDAQKKPKQLKNTTTMGTMIDIGIHRAIE